MNSCRDCCPPALNETVLVALVSTPASFETVLAALASTPTLSKQFLRLRSRAAMSLGDENDIVCPKFARPTFPSS